MKIEKQDIILCSLKSIIGAIPFAGTGLNELIDFIPNIKQKRLNRFTEILADFFIENPNLSLDNIRNEEFSDIFQSILLKVIKTNSEKKLQYFKSILVSEIQKKNKTIEVIETYLDLISSLSEYEILILSNHIYFNKEYNEQKVEYLNIKQEFQELRSSSNKNSKYIGINKKIKSFPEAREYLAKMKKYFESFDKYKKSEFYNLNNRDFLFYKQSLFSKGLLIEVQLATYLGYSEPFQNMTITEFGEDFIRYIKTVGNNG